MSKMLKSLVLITVALVQPSTSVAAAMCGLQGASSLAGMTAIVQEIGYNVRLGRFYAYDDANGWPAMFITSFGQYAENLPEPTPAEFNGIKTKIAKYAKRKVGHDAARIARENGVSYEQIADRIVRNAYCFGVDPYIIAGKIFKESTFKMKARPSRKATAAVGLSQMTPIAIREVNDQLGIAGGGGRDADSPAMMRAAFNCVRPGMKTMADGMNGLSKQGWLLGDDGTDRLEVVDRQIGYGAAHLKTYLAQFGGYDSALKNYGPGGSSYVKTIKREANSISGDEI